MSDPYPSATGETLPAESVRALFEGYHNSDEFLVDRALDAELGLEVAATERELMDNWDTVAQNHPGEDLWIGGGYVWTKYNDIRSDIKALELSKDDVIYDLGSGCGRFPLYAGLTAPATAKGIEIVPERVAAANAAKDRLDLDSVEFIEGSVLDHDFSDGTVFYMFNPFSQRTFAQVKANLKEIAAEKPITLVVSNDWVFGGSNWLDKVAQPNMHTDIYRSNHLAAETSQPPHQKVEAEEPSRTRRLGSIIKTPTK